MKNYPIDLSDNQWQFIKKTLQLGDRKRKHGLRSRNNKALNGYDGNKKVKGIKRHVIVDKNGFFSCRDGNSSPYP